MLADGDPSAIIFPTLIVLLVGILLFVIATFIFRRKVKEPDETPPAGFTLSDLRQLHQSGKMNDAEFERAKAKLLAVTKHAAAAAAPPATRKREGLL
jgi:hypothetical protein